jgi:hypothetical protein
MPVLQTNKKGKSLNKITKDQFEFQLEGEADEFSKKVLDMLEDNRRDLSENAEELKQLQERVKYNYDRLDNLTEIPLKVNKIVCYYNLNQWFIRIVILQPSKQNKTHFVDPKITILQL